MKMADERDTTNKTDEPYGAKKYSFEMSAQERLKKEDANYESPESPHSDYEYSLREENIRLKSRLEQAKEKALVLERNVTQYKEELQKEKDFSEKANKSIYTLMNEKQSMEDELNRKQSSGHHKGVEEVVRKLEHEIHLLEERLERQRKRHHHEHLMMYDDLKDERRKQQEWKQTYLRSQVSVMAFRRKLDLMKDKINQDDRAELMKCLEVGLNDYEDYINDRKDEDHHKNDISHHQSVYDSHDKLHSPSHGSSPSQLYSEKKRSSQETSSHRYDKIAAHRSDASTTHSSVQHEKHYAHVEKTHGAGHSSLGVYSSRHNNSHTPVDHQDHCSSERHNGYTPSTHHDVISSPSTHHDVISSPSYKEHSPRHSSKESPPISIIDHNQPPKVFIMDDENTIHHSEHHNEIHLPVHVETSHHALESSHHSMEPSPHAPATSSCHHGNTAGSGSTSSQSTRYELDSNKHHRHHMSSPKSPPLQHRHSGEGFHASNRYSSSSSNERSTHYKHWHHYSVDKPGHNSGPGGRNSTLHRTDLRRDDDHSSTGYHHHLDDTAKYSHPYKTKFTDYSKDHQLDLNVNDTKFLELKFDHGFLKTESRGSSSISGGVLHKLVTSPSASEGSGKSLIPPGTPLEHKKVWCLTCDGEVTKKPCGHSNLVVQEREKEFPCPTCHRIFNNRSHLKRHNMIHSGEKPWACTYCEKRFNRKSHLNRHLLTHTGERPFKCPYCGKGFADNSDLKRHKQIHESTPGFIPIRPKEPLPIITTTASNTAILVSTAHVITPYPNTLLVSTTSSPPGTTDSSFVKTGENSFVKKKSEPRFPCSKCGKVFTRKSHLTRHKLTHDQVRIYCDCGRMFRQKAHLQAHLPACKRKRDAVEAKYLAEHGKLPPSHNTMIKMEYPPSPVESEQPGDDGGSEFVDNHLGNNNEGEYYSEKSEDSRRSYEERENGSPSRKRDVDLSFSFTALPPGIPPLIRDPA